MGTPGTHLHRAELHLHRTPHHTLRKTCPWCCVDSASIVRTVKYAFFLVRTYRVISDHSTLGRVVVTVVTYIVVGAIGRVSGLFWLKPDEGHGFPGETFASQWVARFCVPVAVTRHTDRAPDILS